MEPDPRSGASRSTGWEFSHTWNPTWAWVTLWGTLSHTHTYTGTGDWHQPAQLGSPCATLWTSQFWTHFSLSVTSWARVTSDFLWFSDQNLRNVLYPLSASLSLRLPVVLCNQVLVPFCTCPPSPLCLPCVPRSPTPVLLMACQPCRGAGRIWCCRSHKVRPWGWGGPGSFVSPSGPGRVL